MNKKNKWFSTGFYRFLAKKSKNIKHTSVWDLLELVETCWNPLGHVGTRWHLLEPVGTCLQEVIFLTQYNNNNNNNNNINILWIRKINAFQMCFSVSTNTKKTKKTLIVLINYYTIRVFATLTYSTRNQLRSVGTCLQEVIFLP